MIDRLIGGELLSIELSLLTLLCSCQLKLYIWLISCVLMAIYSQSMIIFLLSRMMEPTIGFRSVTCLVYPCLLCYLDDLFVYSLLNAINACCHGESEIHDLKTIHFDAGEYFCTVSNFRSSFYSFQEILVSSYCRSQIVLQGVSIALLCKPCTSYDRQAVCPSVRLSRWH